MAISLNDVEKTKSHNLQSMGRGALRKIQFEKEKALRPWETYDSSETQTRTLRAQEAVRGAQAIVERNELFSLKLAFSHGSDAEEKGVEKVVVAERAREGHSHHSIPIERYYQTYNGKDFLKIKSLWRGIWQLITKKKNV